MLAASIVWCRAGVDALRQYDLCTDLDERCYFRFDVRGVAGSLGLLDGLAGGLALLDEGIHDVATRVGGVKQDVLLQPSFLLLAMQCFALADKSSRSERHF